MNESTETRQGTQNISMEQAWDPRPMSTCLQAISSANHKQEKEEEWRRREGGHMVLCTLQKPLRAPPLHQHKGHGTWGAGRRTEKYEMPSIPQKENVLFLLNRYKRMNLGFSPSFMIV